MFDRSFVALLAALIALGLAGCTASMERRVAGMVAADPGPAAFTVCHGSGCKVRTSVELSDAQWGRLRALFEPAPADAAAERARIADAIGLMERLVAKQAGTGQDAARNLVASDQSTQLDCIDEAVNSTTYLRMIAADGLLRFYAVRPPAHRGGILLAHNTAVVREIATGQDFAVDSWFFANGEPPAILPLAAWRDGWEPGDTIAATPAAIQAGEGAPPQP
jgi:hypothetical protein